MALPGSSPRWREVEARLRPIAEKTEQPMEEPACETLPPLDPPKKASRSIIRIVAQKHGITVQELLGQSRFAHIVHARQEAMHEMRLMGMSYHQIGRFMGGRDHSTVWHGVRAHEERTAEPDADHWEPIGAAARRVVETLAGSVVE
jgi:chromosomal replication initiation ATPase DnaA